MVSELTHKIVAFTEIPDFDTDECVDWAGGMISLGFETDATLILASLTKPKNYFETIEYLEVALTELGFLKKIRQDGEFSYIFYLIMQIARANNVKRDLSTLYYYSKERGYECKVKGDENDLFDFYFLFWAWGDLDYGNARQDYWPEANAENVEKITVQWAKQKLLVQEVQLNHF